MGKPKRSFSSDFKLKVCQEVASGIKSRADTLRENNLVESVLAKWLAKFKAYGVVAFTNNTSEMALLKKRITELEKTLGRKTLEVEILQEALKTAALKRGICTT